MKSPSGPLVAAFVLLAITLAVATVRGVRAADGHFIYALDDSYIQMAIGKNLAAHGIWGVTRYEFSGSGTSLLWPLLLAGCQRAFGTNDWFAFVLNVVAAVLLLSIASSILRRHGVSPALRLATLSAIVVGLPLAVLVLYGMEHTLQSAVALTVAALSARAAVERGAVDRFFMPVLALSALTLAVRYDSAALLVPAVAVMAPGMRLRKTLTVIACAAAPAVVYAIVAWRLDWPVLPVSILLKQRQRGLDLSTWRGLIAAAGGSGVSQLTSSPPLLVLVLLTLVLLVVLRGDQRPLARESRILLFIFLIASLLHLQFDWVSGTFRYEAYLIALGLVAVAAGLAHTMTGPSRSSWLTAPATRLVTVAAVASALARQGYLAQREAVAETAVLYHQPVQMGRFLQMFPRRGTVMIDDDLGALAYFSDARLLDLGGLASVDVTRALLANADLDAETVERLASAHDARTAVIMSTSAVLPAGWTCVSRWSGPGYMALYAASPTEAGTLELDLASFDRARPSSIRREPCASP